MRQVLEAIQKAGEDESDKTANEPQPTTNPETKPVKRLTKKGTPDRRSEVAPLYAKRARAARAAKQQARYKRLYKMSKRERSESDSSESDDEYKHKRWKKWKKYKHSHVPYESVPPPPRTPPRSADDPPYQYDIMTRPDIERMQRIADYAHRENPSNGQDAKETPKRLGQARTVFDADLYDLPTA